MHDGLKIVIGAGATALLAWTVHGPMGQGKAFVVGLEQDAQARLATRGLPNVKVAFPTSPYARTAHLSGSASLIQQDDALTMVRSFSGVSGAVWSAGDADRPAASATETAGNESEEQIDALRATALRDVLNDMAAPQPPEKKLAQSAAAAPQAAPTPSPTPKPAAAATPAPAGRPSANPCQRGIDAALGGRVMSFRSGSAWLNPQSGKMIEDVAAVLKRCRAYGIEIGGHTDGKGDEGVNRAMSQERANRVREALIAKGVPAGAVVARGYGSGRPIRAGNTLDPANRRISFTISRGGA